MKIDKYVKDLYKEVDSFCSSSSGIGIDDDSSSNNNIAKHDLEEESYESRFNKFVREVMPYYKAEVMRRYNITSDEEYKRRVLEGDNSIYLPQPNEKFRRDTMWDERAAHALGVDYQWLQDKISKGEIKKRIEDNQTFMKNTAFGVTKIHRRYFS